MNNTPKLPVTLSKADTPQGKRQRSEQLRAVIEGIREADFPRDYDKFWKFSAALRKETPEGRQVQARWLTEAAKLGSKFKQALHDIIFLPLLQADLATATARHREQLTAGLESPKRKLAEAQQVPAEAARLEAEADHDEEQARSHVIAQLTGADNYKRFVDAAQRGAFQKPKLTPEERQRRANRKQDRTPPRPTICVWSKPMSCDDYGNATARNRKTIERWLGEFKARPACPGRHAAEPDRYDETVSLRILSRWIGSPKLKREVARALAADTLAYTLSKDFEFARKVGKAISVPLKRRKLLGEEFCAECLKYWNHYSPPKHSDQFSYGLGIPATSA